MIISKKTAARLSHTVNNGGGGVDSQPLKQMLLQLQAKWRVLKPTDCFSVGFDSFAVFSCLPYGVINCSATAANFKISSICAAADRSQTGF